MPAGSCAPQSVLTGPNEGSPGQQGPIRPLSHMENQMRLANNKIAAVAAGAVVLASAGTAYAYWTTSGTGSGSASTGTSSAFVVTTDAPAGDPLTPGGPTQTVGFTVTNPSSGVQRLQAVAVTVASANASAWTAVPGCSAADYTVGTPAFTAGDIAAGASRSGTVTITMIDRNVSQDGCKGATVPLHVAAS